MLIVGFLMLDFDKHRLIQPNLKNVGAVVNYRDRPGRYEREDQLIC